MNNYSDFFNKKNVFYIFKYSFIAVFVALVVEISKFFFDIEEPKSAKIEEVFFSNIIRSSISIVLISPILEEITFRLPIKKSNYYATSIILCLFFLASSSFIFVKTICLLFTGVVLVYQRSELSYTNLLKNVIIVLSMLTFVVIHFDNYEIEQLKALNSVSLVILFIPQLVICMILTKVRLETCLLNCIVIHSLYNLLIVTLGFFLN